MTPDGASTPVPVQPSPQTFTLGLAADAEGSKYVMLTLNGVNGSWTIFLDPMGAKALAAQLERNASMAQTGLTLPPGLIT